MKKNINDRVYSCVPDDVDFVAGCQKLEQEAEMKNELYRCLAFRNISQKYSGEIIPPFDVFHFIDSLEFKDALYPDKLTELNIADPIKKEIKDTFYYASVQFFQSIFLISREFFRGMNMFIRQAMMKKRLNSKLTRMRIN